MSLSCLKYTNIIDSIIFVSTLYKVHVSDDTCNTDGFMTTIVSPLTDQRKKIFAMDCEMVMLFHLSVLQLLCCVDVFKPQTVVYNL